MYCAGKFAPRLLKARVSVHEISLIMVAHMKKIIGLSASSIILSAMLAACAPASEQAPDESAATQTPTPVAVAETAAAPSAAPSGQRPRDAIARAIYDTNCSGCHGTDPSGGRAASLFGVNLLNEKSDETLRLTIMEGIVDAGMPSFDGMLDDAEIAQLLAFIRNESANFAEKPVFVPSPDGFLVDSEKQLFRIELLASGLDVPWGMAFLPDGRLLITERSGRLRIYDNGQLLDDPVSGTPAVHVGQDAGLFDVILHPDYENTGWIYLSFAEALPDVDAAYMTVVVRGKLNSDNEWVETQQIFRAPPELYGSSGAHYGSRFLFDDAGHLFYTIGDRGDMANAQTLSNALGKIHRVNDDGSVPEDNPFVGVDGAVETIWSYGHRNPQGLSFDPSSGLLWESEHGPTGGDEINVIEAGKNYGWGVVSMGLERGITQHSAPGMEKPVVYYTPALSPSGITFYEGDQYPQWSGSLFVAGLAGQQLRRLEVDGREVVHQEVLFNQFGRTRTAVTGPDGLLYVLLQNPTGAGTGLRLSDPTPGILIRLMPEMADN